MHMHPVFCAIGKRGETRASMDPDDFTAGFAVWSGTSFAAPVFAGQLAEALLADKEHPAPGTSPGDRVHRGRSVLGKQPSVRARP